MRKVFLDNLPKWEDGKYKDKIKWGECVGYKVKFVYNDVKGEFQIVDYDSKSRMLKCKYEDNEPYLIKQGNLQNCQISLMIGIHKKEHVYRIGEIVEDVNSGKLEILDKIRMSNGSGSAKGYRYKCLICGNEDKIREYSLKNKNGCNICCTSPRKILKGHNDIHKTNPQLGKLLWNHEDGYKYSQYSGKKVDWKCHNCGNRIKNKEICKISNYGLPCPKCSDGLSIPEKFMFNVLTKLKVNFETQVIFNWSKNVFHESKVLSGNKKYDFYLENLNMIIETHGRQHYEECNWAKKGGRNLKEEQDNDKLKKNLALKNGIEEKSYIVVDCRKSELEWMKSSILNSELNNVYNLACLNDEDWKWCFRDALGTRVKETCELWNEGVCNVKKICKIMKLGKSAVTRYLKQGSELGWCDYNPIEEINKNNKENGRRLQIRISKRVVRLTLKNELVDVWESMSEAEKQTGISNSKISAVCKGNYGRKTAGGYKWMYKEDYDRYIKEQNKQIS